MDVSRPEIIRALLLASPDAVILVDDEGKIESASPPVERLFGYPPGELTGKPIEILIPEELRSVHESHRSRYTAQPVPRSMGSGLALFGRRRDGTSVPVDVSLSPIVVGGERRVGAFVRDATERRRNENVLRYVNEISRHLLASEATSDTLHLIARRARSLVGATAAWVVVPKGDGLLRVEAADGEATDDLVGLHLSATESLSARTMATASPMWIEDLSAHEAVLAAARRLGLGPGLYLPMLAHDAVVGVLVVARANEAEPFDPAEAQALEVFASAASIVLSLGQAREEVELLRIVSEHERIARDLHDSVIQRLFAVGMSLQGLLRLADGVLAERIDESVDAIDDVIREIRQTIFELNTPRGRTGEEDSVRRQLRDLVAGLTRQLGFEPRVAFRGDVDAAVGQDLAPHLLAVVREGLSNVARHASASAADVVIVAEDGVVELTVADNGTGIPDGPAAGQGLTNLRTRAEKFGGRFDVSPRRPSGTLLVWSVPRSK